ncbi:MAG: KdsC family phosphatase [Schwartzia sp. (in: firmicutes)]
MGCAIERAASIRLLVLDADGTLTDGGIYTGGDGELLKRFDIKDGLGISLWHKAGGKTAVITGRSSDILAVRAKELGIADLHQGCLDKRKAWETLKAHYDLADKEMAYVGDDLIDLPLLRRAGFAAAPSDAVDEVKAWAHFVAAHRGGHGSVREVVEFLLKAQGRWNDLVKPFLS